MKNILYISSSPNVSGAERSLLITMKNLKHYKPLLIVPQRGPLENIAKNNCIRVIIISELIELRKTINLMRIYRNFKLLKKGINRIVHICKAEKINLIHANSINALLYGGWAARIYNIPTVLHLRDIVQSFLTKGIINIISCLLADKTIVISHATANQLLDKKNRVLIYNSFERLCNIKHENVLCRKQKKIIMVARYKKWKGHEKFIKIALRLLNNRNDCIFEIYGDYKRLSEKKYYNRLYKLIPIKYKEKIVFKGFESNIKKIYQNAFLLLHLPERPEPFGRVVIEAGLFKVPVIASNNGGLKEIISHKKDGFLVYHKDYKSIIRYIELLLDNKDYYRKYSYNLYEKVINNFSLDKHISQIEKIYGKLINAN